MWLWHFFFTSLCFVIKLFKKNESIWTFVEILFFPVSCDINKFKSIFILILPIFHLFWLKKMYSLFLMKSLFSTILFFRSRCEIRLKCSLRKECYVGVLISCHSTSKPTLRRYMLFLDIKGAVYLFLMNEITICH